MLQQIKILILAGCLLLVAAADVTATDWNTPGAAYQACSTLTIQQAEGFTAKAQDAIAEIRTEIRKHLLNNGATAYDIFLSHPTLTPAQIRNRLGSISCGVTEQSCPK